MGILNLFIYNNWLIDFGDESFLRMFRFLTLNFSTLFNNNIMNLRGNYYWPTFKPYFS
jgi:hypothetical protein